MSYRVVYTRTVTQQIDDQINFFLHDRHVSSAVVAEWLTGLYDAIDTLYHSPKRYGVVDRLSEAMGFPVHRMPYGRDGSYLIYYRVDDTARIVEVLRFKHAAQHPDTHPDH